MSLFPCRKILLTFETFRPLWHLRTNKIYLSMSTRKFHTNSIVRQISSLSSHLFSARVSGRAPVLASLALYVSYFLQCSMNNVRWVSWKNHRRGWIIDLSGNRKHRLQSVFIHTKLLIDANWQAEMWDLCNLYSCWYINVTQLQLIIGGGGVGVEMCSILSKSLKKVSEFSLKEEISSVLTSIFLSKKFLGLV